MKLKQRRIAAGLLQQDVAKKMNLTQGAISKWETGETHPPKKHHKKLAKLYGCTVDELLREERKED